MRPDGRFLLLLGCFFTSGVAALAYETAWTQQFTLAFGASEMAVVAVLAAYMAGLALGAAAGVRLVQRVPRPVAVYAALELGIAASALAVPHALRAAGWLQVRLFGGAGFLPEAGSWATIAFHLAASFGILALPTACMGATLPLLVRFAVHQDHEIGGRVGALYTANTLGAATGALLTGFVFLPGLGLGSTVLVAAALNVCAFLLALPLAGETAPPAPASSTAPSRSFILPLVLVSSAVSFTCEVLWTRLLTFVLGASIYAFATMLATFLAGIALGSAVGARLAVTPLAARRGFALAQLGTAACSLAAFHAVDWLPALTARLTGGAGFLLAGATCSALTLLPGAICVGATFPFAVRILAEEAGQAGPASARVYGWSTVGAVAGAVLGGLALLPALRLEGTMFLACATGLLLAVAAALLARPRGWRAVACAGAGLVVLWAWAPRPPWNLLRHSTLPGQWIGDVAYYGVGRGSTVLVLDLGTEWRLTSNGLPESAIQGPGARPSRYGVAHWLSLLALAARPDARSLMVVGLGAGKTVEDVPPSVRSISVVELEPEIVAANRALSGRRRKDPLLDPRVQVRVNDARSALALTRERFDAVVSQPSHPWTAGASGLFTREFFELVGDRLSDDGVLVQWMGQQFVDESLLRCLLATVRSVFPHVEVYEPPPGGSLLLLASRRPLAIGDTAPRAIRAAPDLWAAQGVLGVEDVLVARVQDEDGVTRIAAGAPLNTDQRNLLQVRSPRILGRALGPAGSDRVFAPFDPLRREAAGGNALYLVRTLIREGRLPRARRLAMAMPDVADRDVALALLDLAAGQARRGGAGLVAAYARWPEAASPLHALMLTGAQALVAGRDPGGLLPRLRDDTLASAVLEGWRLERAGGQAEIQSLESRLAEASPRHALHEPALKLRLAWRLAASDPDLAREGLELLDPLLATSANARDLLLRARLARNAGDPKALLASLYEITEGSGPYRVEAAREGLALLDELPAGARGASPARRVRERLELLVSGGSVPTGADAAP